MTISVNWPNAVWADNAPANRSSAKPRPSRERVAVKLFPLDLGSWVDSPLSSVVGGRAYVIIAGDGFKCCAWYIARLQNLCEQFDHFMSQTQSPSSLDLPIVPPSSFSSQPTEYRR